MFICVSKEKGVDIFRILCLLLVLSLCVNIYSLQTLNIHFYINLYEKISTPELSDVADMDPLFIH